MLREISHFKSVISYHQVEIDYTLLSQVECFLLAPWVIRLWMGMSEVLRD